jgi:hypothetical protein
MTHNIEYKVTPIASEALTNREIDHVLHEICGQAFGGSGWQPGKCLRMNFAKQGRGFSISLDYLVDGRFKAILGLPQEVVGPLE